MTSAATTEDKNIDLKASWVNGMVRAGVIPQEQNVVADVGSGELKFLIRNEDGLFVDFDPKKHDALTGATKIKKMLNSFEDLAKTNENVLGVDSGVVTFNKGMEGQAREALLPFVADKFKDSGIPSYATGKWREECPDDMFPGHLKKLSQELEVQYTGDSMEYENRKAERKMAGSLAYTAMAGGLQTSEKETTISDMKGKFKDLAEGKYTFTPEDVVANNANYARTMTVLIHAQKYDKVNIVTGNSTLGFAVPEGIKCRVVLALDFTDLPGKIADEHIKKDPNLKDAFELAQNIVERDKLQKKVDKGEASVKDQKELLALREKINTSAIPEKIFNEKIQEISAIQFKASVILSQYHFDNPKLGKDELKTNMEAKLAEIMGQGELDTEYKKVARKLKDSDKKLLASRKVKTTQNKVKAMAEALKVGAQALLPQAIQQQIKKNSGREATIQR